MAAALGDQREAHRRQRFDLADDPVAAAVGALAAAAAPQRELAHPQRELGLQRLDRRVEGVRHRDVDRARAVGVGAGALAAAERLVVGEARSFARVRLFIVPWPWAGTGPAPRERGEDEVGDAAGGLDVAGGDGGGEAGVEQASRRGARTSIGRWAPARGRRVGVGEDADGEEGRRLGHRERAVEVARRPAPRCR